MQWIWINWLSGRYQHMQGRTTKYNHLRDQFLKRYKSRKYSLAHPGHSDVNTTQIMCDWAAHPSNSECAHCWWLATKSVHWHWTVVNLTTDHQVVNTQCNYTSGLGERIAVNYTTSFIRISQYVATRIIHVYVYTCIRDGSCRAEYVIHDTR